MVSLASFFNVADRLGLASALSLGAFETELIGAGGSENAVSRDARVRRFENEAVYGESDATGTGGLPDEEGERARLTYLTTPDDALVADLAPLEIDRNQARDQIVYYVIEDGDTLSDIAARFNVEASTLLWANNLASANFIRAGQRLEVLPVDGVKYVVKKGDTVSSLAQKFSADAQEIIEYNHLLADGSLRPDDALIIPNGRMPSAPRVSSSAVAVSSSRSRVDSNKYFIFPVTGRRTQGFHGNNGVDIANQCGTPIYAAADGSVTMVNVTNSRARAGSAVYGGFGNHIRILHPNGVETLYAHLKDIYVFDGQEVRQGSMIATMGGGFEYVNGKLVRMEGAGRSSGCHLHFEVHGARNPLL